MDRMPIPVRDRRMSGLALTRAFREAIVDRIQNDPAFAQALMEEAKLLLDNGEAELARQILRDLANANLEQ